MRNPSEYLISELQKHPEEYKIIHDQAMLDDELHSPDTFYLFLSRYEGDNAIVKKWADKWEFLISYLYILNQ